MLAAIQKQGQDRQAQPGGSPVEGQTGPARAGAVCDTCGPAVVSVPADTSVGPANNTQLAAPKVTTGQPRAHKTRAGANGNHTWSFK